MDSLFIPCPQCLSKNRVSHSRLAHNPTCGRCKTPLLSSHPVALNDTNFQRYIQSSDLPIIVDFWAPWCGPCRSMAPQYEAAAKTSKTQALFTKLDTDASPQTAAQYTIRSIPTLIAFQAGKEITRQSGAMTQHQILNWLKQLNTKTHAA